MVLVGKMFGPVTRTFLQTTVTLTLYASYQPFTSGSGRMLLRGDLYTFPDVCDEQNSLFFTGSWTVSICEPVDQNWCFKPNQDVFLTLTKCVFFALTLTDDNNRVVTRKEKDIHPKQSENCNNNKCPVWTYLWFCRGVLSSYLYIFFITLVLNSLNQ